MEQDELPPEQFGYPRAPNPKGKWSSCIRLLNPFQGETLSHFELDDNEAAFSLTIMNFANMPHETFAIVGTARDVVLSAKTCSSGFLKAYKFVNDGNALEYLHSVTKSFLINH